MDAPVAKLHDALAIQLPSNSHSKTIKVTGAEWRILKVLSMNYGNVISRTQLIDECFEYTRESYDRIIDTHIKNIRAKLGASGQNWIETVRGYGYRFKGVKKLD